MRLELARMRCRHRESHFGHTSDGWVLIHCSRCGGNWTEEVATGVREPWVGPSLARTRLVSNS